MESTDQPDTSDGPHKLVERARLASVEMVAARRAAERERAKLAELRAIQRRDQAERDRLRTQKEKEDALRLIDGEEAVPRKPRRDNKLARLDEDAAARAAAVQVQAARLAQAETAASVPHGPYVKCVLDLTSDFQAIGVDAARIKLAEMVPSLAHLLAADQIRAATLGEQYPMPRDCVPPFRGLTVVRNFVRAIPDRLRPQQLTEERLLDAAHLISSDIIAKIQGV